MVGERSGVVGACSGMVGGGRGISPVRNLNQARCKARKFHELLPPEFDFVTAFDNLASEFGRDDSNSTGSFCQAK